MIKNKPALPALEDYDVPGQYAFADSRQARRYADLRMEAHEARSQAWNGRSTVRSLCAGTRMRLTGAPRQEHGTSTEFLILRVTSVGVNNLPPPAQLALAELFGAIPELLEELMREPASEQLQLSLARRRQNTDRI